MRWASRTGLTIFIAGHFLVGCGSTPPPAVPFDPTCEGRAEAYFSGIEKTSAGGEMTVRIVSAIPAPPANTDDNEWTVSLTDATGTPMEGATVVAAPYMVDHGHGAPNVIGVGSGGGSYALDSIYLRMTGLWQVTIRVWPSGSELENEVMFPFCVPPI